jgi:hypothetical protein
LNIDHGILNIELELELESTLKSQYKENSGAFLWKGFRIGQRS